MSQRFPSLLAISAAVLLVATVLPIASAAADETPPDAAAPPPAPPASADPTNLLLGDVGGVRTELVKEYGITPAVTETDEVLGNVTGGTRQGFTYEGLTDFSLALDLKPLFHWRGNFLVRAYQIRGNGLTAANIDNLNTISGIEATPTTRLFELWYEQHIGDWLRIRIGQQNAAEEFLIATGGKPFVNSTFGWPTLAGVDLPSGGPNYPLATPAVRVRIDVNDELTLFSGVFNGNPAGPGSGNPQLRDASGTGFPTDDGVFAIDEIRYNPGNSPKNGTYRLGAWYNSERFADQELDALGLSLASPLRTRIPRLHNGDTSLYAIVDQPLFGGGPDGFAVFARVMGAPGDRNLVDAYLDSGVTYKNPAKNMFDQAGDTVGFAVGYARIGSAARALAADMAAITDPAYPQRSSETVVELTYQIQLVPGWQVQPDLQYVVNPGGGIPNPLMPSNRIRNAVIAGVRTTINF